LASALAIARDSSRVCISAAAASAAACVNKRRR
jgi:hypothetical protein